MMRLNTGMRRMDSLMVASNIKKMSRLELLYTCVTNRCRLMSRKDDTNFPKSMKHYIKDITHNEVLYHNWSIDSENKINTILKDAALLITACSGNYDESNEYQLLVRVIGEQAKTDGNGNLTLKEKSSGMNSKIIQNPTDPDAIYRKKAGAEYRGYIANVVEQVDHEKSLVIDYQVDQNIYIDSQFLKDYIECQLDSNEETILATDGCYCGNENTKIAASKNINLSQPILKVQMSMIYGQSLSLIKPELN